jgi:hypothetical protein
MGKIDQGQTIWNPCWAVCRLELAVLPDSGLRRNAGLVRLDRVMQDLWMLLFTVAFFVLAFGYVHACHKLR